MWLGSQKMLATIYSGQKNNAHMPDKYKEQIRGTIRLGVYCKSQQSQRQEILFNTQTNTTSR